MSNEIVTAKWLLVFILGVSGAWKNTMLHLLKERNPNFSEVISCKTRPLRPWEVDGVDYRYMDDVTFQTAIEQNVFLEHAHYALYWYGTRRNDIIEWLQQNKIIIKEIEMQGITSISHTAPEIYNNSLRIFLDLSEETMVQRITNRAGITPEELDKRLVSSRREKQQAAYYCNAIILAEAGVEEVYAKIIETIADFVSKHQ